MYDQTQLNELQDRLEVMLNRALHEEQDYEGAAQCARAMDAFKKWAADGFQGPPPAEAQTLSGIQLVEVVDDVSLASEETGAVLFEDGAVAAAQGAKVVDEPIADVVDQASPAVILEGELDWLARLGQEIQEMTIRVERSKEMLTTGQWLQSIADLEAVITLSHTVQAGLSELATVNERCLAQVRAVRQDKLNQAIDRARKHARAQRRDLKGRRSLWEAVLEIDPDSQEAQEELTRLAVEERDQRIRDTLKALRKPLETRDKRISEVEHARIQALALLEGGELHDPDLFQETQELYDKLDELRNAMLRIVEGAIASERSMEFEHAMSAYRNAILAGYKEIIDDRAGEPIDPVDALRRVRLAHFEHLKQSTSQRYKDAQQNLAAGLPEVATRWLEEAQELLAKVEEGGADLRNEVQNLLGEARYKYELKQEAEVFVFEAQKSDDPTEAWSLLLRAKQRYPAYPQIDEMIKGKESLVVRKVIQEITQDIANARGSLYGRKFADARNFCNQALSRGLNLEASSQELLAKRREAEGLLKEIGDQEKSLQDLLNKMAKIDQALAKGDLRLAQRLLDLLGDDERKTAEAGERLAQLGFVSEDDDRFRQAQRAFQEQNHGLAARLCDDLVESVPFGDRANLLRSRAVARLWIEQASDLLTRGDEGARVEMLLNDVLALRDTLPPEDSHVLAWAERALTELNDHQELQQTV